MEVYPKTGRTHQIRVHMASLGHPIVGDDIYGKRAKGLAGRPLLHACRITFDHPVSGNRMTVEAAVPEDMEQFVEGQADEGGPSGQGRGQDEKGDNASRRRGP